jgi:hypothetical protein
MQLEFVSPLPGQLTFLGVLKKAGKSHMVHLIIGLPGLLIILAQ